MCERERKFREILKKYGVTKCRVTSGYTDVKYNFDDTETDIIVRVNVNSNQMKVDIIDLLANFESDYGVSVRYNDFSELLPNYEVEV